MRWTVSTPQPPKEPCPLCGVHAGKHQPHWEDGKPGRICLDCGATWPLETATFDVVPGGRLRG